MDATTRLSGLRLSFVWTAIGRLGAVGALFLLHMVLARNVSTEAYASYAILESSLYILVLLGTAGLPLALQREARIRADRGDHAEFSSLTVNAFWLVAGFSSLVLCIVVGCSVLFREYLSSELAQVSLLCFVTWVLCSSLLRLMGEFERARGDYFTANLVGGQRGGLGINLLVLAVVLGAQFTLGLSLAFVIGTQCCVVILFCCFQLVRVYSHLRAPVSLEVMKGLLVISLPMFATQLITQGIPEFDIFAVGALSSDRELGLYSVGKRIALLGVMPLLLVNGAVQPFISSLGSANDLKRLELITRCTATIACIPSLVILLATMLFPKVLLGVFGSGFVDAVPIVVVLSLGSCIFVATGSGGLVLTMTGRERTNLKITTVSAIIFVMLSPLLTLRFGAIGAAIAVALVQVGANLATAVTVRRMLGIWTVVDWSPGRLAEGLTLITQSSNRKRHARPVS